MEWITKSSLPQRSRRVSNTASIWPGCITSSGSSTSASICLRQRLDVGLGLVVEVGQRDLGTEGAQLGRAAKGNAVAIGDAHHQARACP
jgi:hypothetical protein